MENVEPVTDTISSDINTSHGHGFSIGKENSKEGSVKKEGEDKSHLNLDHRGNCDKAGTDNEHNEHGKKLTQKRIRKEQQHRQHRQQQVDIQQQQQQPSFDRGNVTENTLSTMADNGDSVRPGDGDQVVRRRDGNAEKCLSVSPLRTTTIPEGITSSLTFTKRGRSGHISGGWI